MLPPPALAAKARFLSIGERLLALLGFLVLGYIKFRYIRSLLVNSDEPQHLHVVWGWTQGLLQYRDLFDNHAPLFHMAFAPLLTWLGERADILYYMRIAMVPLSIGTLALVYLITSRLYSRRAAVWATLFAGLHPLYIHVSTEFRADNLWSLAWLATLFFLLTGKLTKGRSFVGGLLLGVTLCVSLKTTLLFGSFAAAAVVVLGARVYQNGWGELKGIAGNLLAGLLGASIVPLGLFAFFAAHDGLKELNYCVFEHNMLPGLLRRDNFSRWNFPLLAPLLLAATWGFYHSAALATLSIRRAIAFLGPFLAFVLLVAYWPLVTRQDFCAILPPLMISAGPAILALAGWVSRTWVAHSRGAKAWGGPILALLILGGYGLKEIRDSLTVWAIEEDVLDGFEAGLAFRLKLTSPSDYVMDAKGETIYRKRAFYPVLERVTQIRIKNGLMEDTIQADCIAKNTSFISTYRLKNGDEWLKKGYINIKGGFWIPGQMLPAPEATPASSNNIDGAKEPKESATAAPLNTRHFKLLIATRYRFLSPKGAVQGIVDGQPMSEETIYLKAGEHEFTTSEAGPLAVLWENAERVHFSPFTTGKAGDKKKERTRRYQIPTNPFSP